MPTACCGTASPNSRLTEHISPSSHRPARSYWPPHDSPNCLAQTVQQPHGPGICDPLQEIVGQVSGSQGPQDSASTCSTMHRIRIKYDSISAAVYRIILLGLFRVDFTFKVCLWVKLKLWWLPLIKNECRISSEATPTEVNSFSKKK